jgi:hypothetical protein
MGQADHPGIMSSLACTSTSITRPANARAPLPVLQPLTGQVIRVHQQLMARLAFTSRWKLCIHELLLRTWRRPISNNSPGSGGNAAKRCRSSSNPGAASIAWLAVQATREVRFQRPQVEAMGMIEQRCNDSFQATHRHRPLAQRVVDHLRRRHGRLQSGRRAPQRPWPGRRKSPSHATPSGLARIARLKRVTLRTASRLKVVS